MKKRTKSRAARSSKAWSTATVSVDIRSIFVDSRGKRWRWVVDDRMRDYGDIDYERRIIRINRAMHARNRESLIDTLFHEASHQFTCANRPDPECGRPCGRVAASSALRSDRLASTPTYACPPR